MPNAQNKQLLSIPAIPFVHKLLKFCYFMVLLCFLSCGNEQKEKPAQESQTEDQTEETIAVTSKTKSILCFGDSITAGYGLDDTNDAFPAILQQKVDSLNLDYTVINSGLSGETTAGGKNRVNWTMKQKVDVFILELGANDGLRGVPLSETKSNLQAIIDLVIGKSPDTTIILAGMQLPPNMGQEYTAEFKKIYKDLAAANDLKFIPFILENVGGIAELNQNDGIHPTAEGHKIIANTVWDVLKTVITN